MKPTDYITQTLNSILLESKEYQSYSLGYAYGLFYYYLATKELVGENIANQQFQSIINSKEPYSEYFRELIKSEQNKIKGDKQVLDKIYNIHEQKNEKLKS